MKQHLLDLHPAQGSPGRENPTMAAGLAGSSRWCAAFPVEVRPLP